MIERSMLCWQGSRSACRKAHMRQQSLIDIFEEAYLPAELTYPEGPVSLLDGWLVGPDPVEHHVHDLLQHLLVPAADVRSGRAVHKHVRGPPAIVSAGPVGQ